MINRFLKLTLACVLSSTAASAAVVERFNEDRGKEDHTSDVRSNDSKIESAKFTASNEHVLGVISKLVDRGHSDPNCSQFSIETLRALEAITREKAAFGLAANNTPEKAILAIKKEIDNQVSMNAAIEKTFAALQIKRKELNKCATQIVAGGCDSAFSKTESLATLRLQIPVLGRMTEYPIAEKEIQPASDSYWMPNFRELYEFKIRMRSSSPYGDPQLRVDRSEIIIDNQNGDAYVNVSFGDGPHHDFKALLPQSGWSQFQDGQTVQADSITDFQFPWSAGEKRHVIPVIELGSLISRVALGTHSVAPGTSGSITRRGNTFRITQRIEDRNPSHRNFTVTRNLDLEVSDPADPLHTIKAVNLTEDVNYPGKPSFRTVQVRSENLKDLL